MEAYRQGNKMQWGDWDYINSHDGEPKWWMPLPEPPDGMAGPDCGCDQCTEKFAEQECGDYFANTSKVSE
jgi:hypothetical protein